MQVTTHPRARRRPFLIAVIAASLALIGGALLPTQSDAATKYSYKAPPSVAVANVGKDYAEIVFGTVTGAPNYRIKAEELNSKGKVVKGGTKYATTGPEGYWTITGLKSSTKYKFTVAVVQKSPLKQLSKYSSKSASKTTNKSSYLDSPTDVETRDDPTDTLDKNGQRPYSIDLKWKVPPTFNPAIHQFQIDYATDRVMKAKKGSVKVAGTLDVAPSSRNMRVQPASVDVGTPEPPIESTDETTAPITTEPTTPTPATTTESATPTPTDSPATESAPASAPTPTDTDVPQEESPAAQEAESDTDQVRAFDGSPTDVVLLSAPILPAATTAPTYWARVTGLAANTNWYMRVKIIRKTDGAVLSERSEALMVKTLSPKGYITGTVNLNGQPAKNYVVAAYKGANLEDQVDVNNNGSYQLNVRPGSYNVVAVYIGSGNFSSRWAASDSRRGKTRYDDGAQSVKVATAKATTGVNINPQSTKSYTVSGKISCPGASSSQCTVDVAAMSNWHTDSKRSRVVNTSRSNSSGSYSISGLAPGKYKLRVNHADERYKAKNLYVEIRSDGSIAGSTNGSLVNRNWVKTYPAKIKKTGTTVKVTSKAFIASELPVVRAVQKCQWQRNKVNISGATSCTYKLKAADRGKQVRVRIINTRYGFPNATTYSKAVRG